MSSRNGRGEAARAGIRALLLLGTALFWVAPAHAAGEDTFHLKPGARGKVCLSCHADFEDRLKRTSVHTPVKAGECSKCHNPHATDHGKLLADAKETICRTCHESVVPKDAKSVHPPVLEGGCVKCHDPHGSANRNNLLAAGNELCFGCHKELAAAVEAAKFRHAPVGTSCLSCHDPHASNQSAHLLKKPMPALCAGCHKTDQPAFAKAHLNYPVGKSDCGSCHDPHGSSNAGILWATVHPPVRAKMCGQCHPESGKADSLKAKRAGVDLCRGCHNSMVNQAFGHNRIHWPALDRTACLNCHRPHATKQPKLLAAPQKTLCGGCHRDVVERQDKSLTKHEPVNDGECSACHDPHASDQIALLSSPVPDLCGNCHDPGKHSAHPTGDTVLDPRNKNLPVKCLSCHRSHGTPFKGFTHFDPEADLCVQCHQSFKR